MGCLTAAEKDGAPSFSTFLFTSRIIIQQHTEPRLSDLCLACSVSIQGNGIYKAVQVVGIHCNVHAIPSDHVRCPDGVEIVDVDIAHRTFDTHDAALAYLSTTLIRAGYLHSLATAWVALR